MTTDTTGPARLLGGTFSRPGYFTTDLAKGTIRTPAGTRVCALTDDFLRGFRAAVRFECGKATDRVFKACGVRWGTAFVRRFDQELADHFGTPAGDVSAGLIGQCLDEAFRYHGWGTLSIDWSMYDSGFVGFEVRDPVIPAVAGPADKPTDSLFAGFLAAVVSFYAHADLDGQQTDCPSRGADASRFVVGLAARIAPVPKWSADGLTHKAILGRLRTAAG